jgi:branched-subunit amino acid aminotransferase/4-amino-4-deoxychorismate lyase
MPAVKDSQWVRDRASLEKNKGQEINEVVLIDDSENVYEGMASNFFAVRRRQHDDEEGVNKSDYVIQCASLDHVLLGTIMKLVMALCEKEKIDIEWVFPRLQDARAGKWEGCFLTSTSRLLLPIETIYSKDGRYVNIQTRKGTSADMSLLFLFLVLLSNSRPRNSFNSCKKR